MEIDPPPARPLPTRGEPQPRPSFPDRRKKPRRRYQRVPLTFLKSCASGAVEPPYGSTMERMRLGRLVACAVVAALVAPAAASAHANLVRIRPANGAVLAKPPAAVRVFFDDAIRPGPGVEAVRNGGGSVLSARAYVPSGNPRELVVPLRRGLAAGDYSVRWGIVSDDGHNERGVTAFAVGAGAAPPTASLSAGGVGRTGDVVFRVLLFAGLLAAAGAAAFRLLVWPRGLRDRELSLVVLAGCVLAAVGATGLAARGVSGARVDLVEWNLPRG